MSFDVHARAWKYSRQSGSSLLALLALASCADDDGVIWLRGVTVEFIGSKARTKKRQTQNILRALESTGEIYAPPAAGRGKTTRYFVVIGLSQKQIATVLAREFRLAGIESEQIASELLDRQTAPQGKQKKVQPRASFLGTETALETRGTEEKAQPSTSIKKMQSDAPITNKRCNPLPIKGAIRYAQNGRSEASESAGPDPIISYDHESVPPSSPPTPPSQNGGDGGDLDFFQELRRRGVSRPKAQQIAAMDVDPQTVLISIDNLHDPQNPHSMGRIIGRLIDAPPAADKPYGAKKPKTIESYTPPPRLSEQALPRDQLAARMREMREKGSV